MRVLSEIIHLTEVGSVSVTPVLDTSPKSMSYELEMYGQPASVT